MASYNKKDYEYTIIIITSSGQKDLHRYSWLYWFDAVSYDNMCHLNNLKVDRSSLPLPGKFSHMWMDVKKIIDTLHIANYKDKTCRELYSPEMLTKENPDMNTMCCKQTFAWLSRYKRILSSMPKTHHHFYLHRMVRRRNSYIEKCYANGRRPLLPNIKHT